MKLFLEKSFIRIFTPVFISLFILIVGVSAYVYFQQRNRILTNASGYYSDLLRQRSELLHAKFAPTISDLGFFAHQLLVIKYLDNSTGKPELIKEMQLFAQFNRSYQQIRFINAKGMEQIRINWVGDSLIITPDKLLQDKSQRYYFKKTAALHPGEIYVSPIDLNMEHGKIEIPYQRVIRFGTPIFNKDNQFAGVIIINQNLNTLFNRLKITNDHYNGHLMFLNRDGYWLFGSKENKSFGFMFDSLKNQRLSNLFPKRWNKITKQSSGEIYGPKGMDIFQHVGLGYHAGRGDNFYPGKVYVDAVNDWVLLVHVDYANIKNYKSNKTVFLLVLGVSIFLVLYIAYIMSRLRFKEKKYVAEINAVNKSLEYKIEQRTKELSERNTELKIVNEELESFSYSVSHDLRAPLRHISGFVDLLVKKNRAGLDEKGVRYLDYIKEASQEMSQLIDDLLRFSRVGRTELQMASFEMNNLVEETTRAIQEDYPDQEIRWEITSLPPVTVDYGLMRQVWINLLSNAVKYSSKKAYSLVQVEASETSANYIFKIQDNGVGFDEKYGHKLFGTFQRLHSAEDYEGTGIGLAMVRRIVVRHGGEVWAEGKIGEGATFYFSLPKNPKG